MKKNEFLIFFFGLKAKFNQFRGRLPKTKPIPSIREVYSAIRIKESRLMVLMIKENPAREGSMLKLESALVNNQRSFSKKNDDKDKLWCDHCNKSCHTRDMCWKLHGKPQRSG